MRYKTTYIKKTRRHRWQFIWRLARDINFHLKEGRVVRAGWDDYEVEIHQVDVDRPLPRDGTPKLGG